MAQPMKIFLLTASVLCFCFSCQKSEPSFHQKLSVAFSGKPSQIEIGSPYVGLEMHTSSPLLNRISFYYPIANSIDLSTDYWQRERDRIFFIGIKFGNKPIEWLAPEPMDYELTPYSVIFTKSDAEKTIQLSYEFCKNKPAFVTKIEVTNKLSEPTDVELYTHLATSLRTCHSYKLKDKVRTEFDETGSTIFTNYDDPETGNAQIFVANASEIPKTNSGHGIGTDTESFSSSFLAHGIGTDTDFFSSSFLGHGIGTDTESFSSSFLAHGIGTDTESFSSSFLAHGIGTDTDFFSSSFLGHGIGTDTDFFSSSFLGHGIGTDTDFFSSSFLGQFHFRVPKQSLSKPKFSISYINSPLPQLTNSLFTQSTNNPVTQLPDFPITQLPNHPVTQLPNYPITQFTYSKTIPPQQSLKVIQLIGSCQQDEGREVVKYLLDNHERETSSYQNYVLQKAYHEGIIQTNDAAIDHSAHWAKAILATNIHYLDGEFLPMPCPAEYNFFFSHDALLTDLARVNFDLPRVKSDLEFIIEHATADKIIPHAYYWRDDRYVTEYATPDNWNHFWFILLSASYLRHSSDVSMLEKLYPYIETSLNQVLQNKKEDGLVYAHRPDWWDIGRSFGPRSYMTILTIRALREFIFISTALHKNLPALADYEKLADDMQGQLAARLWDDDLKYLINYFEDGSKDSHFYIGSLLAAHFNLLDQEKKTALMETARQKLLDEKIGIYNVYPMDFHRLIDYLKLAGNEAGDPYCYANGGIWPHGNAWYALGLIAIDKKAEAAQFIKKIMTLAGIIESPNGQPAMYEYRNSNKHDPAVYGKVDKPQFMWAAGWYLYSLYHLLGLRENEWNISLDPYLIEGQSSAQFDVLVNGKTLRVTISGQGDQVSGIKLGGKHHPSLVLTESLEVSQLELTLGKAKEPYLWRTNSIVKSCHYDSNSKKFAVRLKAFAGHRNETVIVAPWQPRSVALNSDRTIQAWDLKEQNGAYIIHFHFIQASAETLIEISFPTD